MTQEDIAKIAGISRSAVSNSIRILGLPEEVQELIKEGLVSVGHAKVLLSVEDEELVKELALRVSEGCVTVRTLEKIVAGLKADEKKSSEKKPSDSYFKEMEISLRESLGRKVTVKNKGNDKGTLVVEFYDKADLLFLADKLAK